VPGPRPCDAASIEDYDQKRARVHLNPMTSALTGRGE